MITLALSKGRIFEETLPLLRAAGIEVLEDPEKSRKLILATNLPDVRVLVVRATDVPTYVQYGGADMGITGKVTLLEHGGDGLYQPLDLQIAKCRISVAVRADFDYAFAVKKGSRLTVATKYVAISREFFASKGVHVDLIKLYGSMELALSLIHISEPTRLGMISYAVFCLKKKKKRTQIIRNVLLIEIKQIKKTTKIKT